MRRQIDDFISQEEEILFRTKKHVSDMYLNVFWFFIFFLPSVGLIAYVWPLDLSGDYSQNHMPVIYAWVGLVGVVTSTWFFVENIIIYYTYEIVLTKVYVIEKYGLFPKVKVYKLNDVEFTEIDQGIFDRVWGSYTLLIRLKGKKEYFENLTNAIKFFKMLQLELRPDTNLVAQSKC